MHKAAMNETIEQDLRPPTELPPLSYDGDNGAWHDTIDVLGYDADGDAFVVYAQVWDPEYADGLDDQVQWKIKGRDSYDFEDMVGWIPLPKIRLKSE